MAKRKATKRTQKKVRGGRGKGPYSPYPRATSAEGGVGVDLRYIIDGASIFIYRGPEGYRGPPPSV